MTKYVSFLRGINVGGHHKISMADLKKEITGLGFENVVTILNSGNIIFDAPVAEAGELDRMLSDHLEKAFGFSIPVLTRRADQIENLVLNDPFRDIALTKDTRLYVSFVQDEPKADIQLPWTSEDGSYRIFEIRDRSICSVLDLSVNGTPQGMNRLEQLFGKNITTRNWKTLNRILAKIK